MKRAEILAILVVAVGLMVCPARRAGAIPSGTAFTYQGRLIDANNIADGLYDFEFRLFDDPSAGAQQGSTNDVNDLDVIEGYFTAVLDFGGVFNGDARWLQIAVRPGGSTGDFSALSPRQEVMPIPYAVFAQNAKTDNDWMLSGNNMYSIPSGNVGIGTTSPNARLDVAGSILWGNSAAAQGMLGYGTNITIGSYNNYNLKLRTNNIDRMTLDTSGKIGIGTTSPSSKLHIEDNTTNDVTAMIHNLDNTGSENLYFGTSSASDAGISVYGSANAGKQGKWEFFNNKTSGNYDWITGGSVKMTLTNQGMLGIGYAYPYAKLFVQESGLADPFQVRVSGSTKLIVKNDGRIGIGTTLPDEQLTVVGNVKINGNLNIYDGSTKVMELGAGLDYAEGFDVSDRDKIGPGSVLIIDADNPGKLTLSNTSYDTKVAGIVAGAKGLGSGVRLGAGQFDYDVALAGRVYCKVDATAEAVKPGDLLTTSSTPGHAMKAVDYALAQGAILGKAMESLEKGQKGQILVLVTLQ
ncbi:MAG: hypothetical protein OEW48_07410 [Phycisphaerae bacterium]|nr:hypothetical protein [Phycisphaerae bacterium]